MIRLKNADSILGAVFLVAGLVFLYISYHADKSAFTLPGDAPPFLVPQIYLYLWIAVAVIILLGGLMGKGTALPTIAWKRFLGIFAMVAFGTVAMNLIGYLPAAIITVFGVTWGLGYRRLSILTAISVGSVAAIWALLVLLARMPLPATPGLGA